MTFTMQYIKTLIRSKSMCIKYKTQEVLSRPECEHEWSCPTVSLD